MNYINWISYRYLTASKGRFLSFLNFVSVAGVALGVAALIIVIGIMTGFQNNLREKIIGSTPHVSIEKETGISDYPQLIGEVKQIGGVQGVSPFISGNIFFEYAGQARGMVLRGVDPDTEQTVTKVDEYLIEGEIGGLKQNGIIIGSELADFYSLHPGDTVTLIAPGSGIAGGGWRYQFQVAGIFKSGMVDADMNLLFVSLDNARDLYNIPGGKVSGIGVKLKDPEKAGQIKQEIYQKLGYSFLVQTWIDVNSNLFEALFLEKLGLFLILTLMVVVAAFNIISTLIVTVTSKVHDIGILQSFGVPRSAIRKIFARQGLMIGLKGIAWGVVAGVAISYILRTYVPVPAQIYSIDRVPVELVWKDLLAIVGTAFVISLLASLYPAVKAASLQPVEALRYE